MHYAMRKCNVQKILDTQIEINDWATIITAYTCKRSCIFRHSFNLQRMVILIAEGRRTRTGRRTRQLSIYCCLPRSEYIPGCLDLLQSILWRRRSIVISVLLCVWCHLCGREELQCIGYLFLRSMWQRIVVCVRIADQSDHRCKKRFSLVILIKACF